MSGAQQIDDLITWTAMSGAQYLKKNFFLIFDVDVEKIEKSFWLFFKGKKNLEKK